MSTFKFVYRLWQQLNRWSKKHEIIPGFLVTMLGVLAAFWLAGIGEQWGRDRTTAQRLHLAILEAKYNNGTVQEILSIYADVSDSNDSNLKIDVRRLDSTAAIAAFQDTNILSFLPFHKVSLLRGYLNDINTLNQTLQTYQSVLESRGYQKTLQEKALRQTGYENAAAVSAAIIVLQEQLKEYFDEKSYNLEEIKKIQDRMESIKSEILNK